MKRLTYINLYVNICIIQKIMFINIPKKGEVYAARQSGLEERREEA